MNDRINIEPAEEQIMTEHRALMRTVEWLMGAQASVIRLHLPHAGQRDGFDIPCAECGKKYPCQSVELAETAIRTGREFMRDFS